LNVSGKAFSLNDLHEILLTLEKEKGSDAARLFVSSLNYKAVCELARKGMAENDPNKMPTRFFLLPGADDSKLESTDMHAEEKSHPVSLANLRKALIILGFQCASDGTFDEELLSSFEKYLQSIEPRKMSEAVTHKVQKGETLGRIAAQYGLPSWRTLYALNEASIGPDPGFIKVGVELKLPVSVRANGDRLIRQKGGDPGKLLGGLGYAYPWAFLHLDLKDLAGRQDLEVLITDRKSGNALWSGNESKMSVLIPDSSDINVGVKGIPIEIAGEKHIHPEDISPVDF
jgi:LysM repeat protein